DHDPIGRRHRARVREHVEGWSVFDLDAHHEEALIERRAQDAESYGDLGTGGPWTRAAEAERVGHAFIGRRQIRRRGEGRLCLERCRELEARQRAGERVGFRGPGATLEGRRLLARALEEGDVQARWMLAV